MRKTSELEEGSSYNSQYDTDTEESDSYYNENTESQDCSLEVLQMLFCLIRSGQVPAGTSSYYSRVWYKLLKNVAYSCNERQLTKFMRELVATGNVNAIQTFCELGFNPFLSFDKGKAPIYELLEGRTRFPHEAILEGIFTGMRTYYINKLAVVETNKKIGERFVYDEQRVYGRGVSKNKIEKYSLLHLSLQNMQRNTSILASSLPLYIVKHLDNAKDLTIDGFPLLHHAVLLDERSLIVQLIQKGCNPYIIASQEEANGYGTKSSRTGEYNDFFKTWMNQEPEEGEVQHKTWWLDTNAFDLARKREPSNYKFLTDTFLDYCQKIKIPASLFERDAIADLLGPYHVCTLLECSHDNCCKNGHMESQENEQVPQKVREDGETRSKHAKQTNEHQCVDDGSEDEVLMC